MSAACRLTTAQRQGGGFDPIAIGRVLKIKRNACDGQQPKNNDAAAHAMPAFARARTPTIEPRNAQANQTQPCKLAEAMPPR